MNLQKAIQELEEREYRRFVRSIFPPPALPKNQDGPIRLFEKPTRPMGYIYLATPYSHPHERVREARYEALMLIYSYLLKERTETFFSPILHCHDTAKQHKIDGTVDTFWRDNKAMVKQSRGLWIIENFTDWHKSIGLNRERGFAEGLNIPIHYVRLKEVLSKPAWEDIFKLDWSVPIAGSGGIYYDVLSPEAELRLVVGSV